MNGTWYKSCEHAGVFKASSIRGPIPDLETETEDMSKQDQGSGLSRVLI